MDHLRKKHYAAAALALTLLACEQRQLCPQKLRARRLESR
jgi:hypothetical protein